MKTCEECKKRSDCTELCDRVEKYISQDYKYQRELAVSEQIIDAISQGELIWPGLTSYFHESAVNFPFLTPLQNRVLHQFHFEGKTYKEIAMAMSGNNKYRLSRNAVKGQIARARAKIRSIYTSI
ncbi:MAG: sigma-70 family RNA polymerase sigma factor [bacterium]|nr:sigma-70 family RNA polymerase sigma factor [bacterium]